MFLPVVFPLMDIISEKALKVGVLLHSNGVSANQYYFVRSLVLFVSSALSIIVFVGIVFAAQITVVTDNIWPILGILIVQNVIGIALANIIGLFFKTIKASLSLVIFYLLFNSFGI